MMMKLYKVLLEYEVCVIADNEHAAMNEARFMSSEESPVADFATEIKSLKDIPSTWKDSCAYGENPEELTCQEFIEKYYPTVYSNPDQIEMFEAFA